MSFGFDTMLSQLGQYVQYNLRQQARLQNIRELSLQQMQDDFNVGDAYRRGALAAGQQRMRGSALLAKQRMAYANSGVNAYSGTPADVAAGSVLFNELDALTIENNAAREALGHKQTSRVRGLQRSQLWSQASADAMGTGIGIATSAIQGAIGRGS